MISTTLNIFVVKSKPKTTGSTGSNRKCVKIQGFQPLFKGIPTFIYHFIYDRNSLLFLYHILIHIFIFIHILRNEDWEKLNKKDGETAIKQLSDGAIKHWVQKFLNRYGCDEGKRKTYFHQDDPESPRFIPNDFYETPKNILIER